MQIRNTLPTELDEVMEIYAQARAFMRATGNADQWGDNHPSRQLIESDIRCGKSYVVESDSEIIGVFFFDICDDPTYKQIYDGKWLNSNKYGVIHRIAVKYHGRGIADFVYKHCFSVAKNLKIDTHADNIPMQNSLRKNGFVRCGIIYLASGDERIAYQKET